MILLLLRNWKLVLVGVVAALIIGAYFYVIHLQHIAQARKVQLAQAVQQAQVQTVATKAVDQVATQAIRVEEHTHETIRTIQAAPGADSPVPPAVLRAWSDGMRDQPDKPARGDPGDAQSALPAT